MIQGNNIKLSELVDGVLEKNPLRERLDDAFRESEVREAIDASVADSIIP